MSIIIILVSTVTWVPGLLLFLLQSYLEGWSWFADNIWIASAIFISSLVLILLLALMSQAISAWVKWLVVLGHHCSDCSLFPQFSPRSSTKISGRAGDISLIYAL